MNKEFIDLVMEDAGVKVSERAKSFSFEELESITHAMQGRIERCKEPTKQLRDALSEVAGVAPEILLDEMKKSTFELTAADVVDARVKDFKKTCLLAR